MYLFLQASEEVTLTRFRGRKRASENHLSEPYLLKINAQFAHFAEKNKMLAINTSHMTIPEAARKVYEIILQKM